MKFWFSAEIDRDVSEAQRLISNEMKAMLNEELSGSDLGSSVSSWDMIFMISRNAAKIIGWPERRRYSKKDKSFEFRLKIDHAAFAAGDEATKRRMMLDVILASIEWARENHKSLDFNYGALRSVVEKVAREKGW